MERRIGALRVLASCVPFALAGVFTKAIHTDLWTLLAWRGVPGGAVIALKVEGRAPMGRIGWAVAATGAVASLGFLGAFPLAPIAHVTLIYALAPFAAAGFARALAGVSDGCGTLGAAAVSLAAGGGDAAHWAGMRWPSP